jgi:PEP-CTERM motif
MRFIAIGLFLLGASLSLFAGGTVPTATPEPSTVLLVAGAGGALILVRQLRKKK